MCLKVYKCVINGLKNYIAHNERLVKFGLISFQKRLNKGYLIENV